MYTSTTGQKQGTPAKGFLSFLVLPLSTFSFDCCTRSHSVGLLWTTDRPFEETSTRQHTTLTKDRHPCHSGIRTHNPIKRSAAAAYLRTRGHRDRRPLVLPIPKSYRRHRLASGQGYGMLLPARKLRPADRNNKVDF